jgi:hypothetical protein
MYVSWLVKVVPVVVLGAVGMCFLWEIVDAAVSVLPCFAFSLGVSTYLPDCLSMVPRAMSANVMKLHWYVRVSFLLLVLFGSLKNVVELVVLFGL